jgi:hypothetical protein
MKRIGTLVAALLFSACTTEEHVVTTNPDTGPVIHGPKSDPCDKQTPGTACTWLGVKGEQGFDGDGHQRFNTQVNQIQDLLFLPDGTAWFTDFNNYLVRKVLPDGTVQSVVGWTDPVFPGDGPNVKPDPAGVPGSQWQLNHPTGLFATSDGLVNVVAWHNHKFLKIDPKTGLVKINCGAGVGYAGDGGPIAKALFKQPVDATVDEAGNIYIVDQQNWRVRKIDTAGNINTIAGDGKSGSIGDGGPALSAEFSWQAGSNPNPSGGIVYHKGKLYISDTEISRIRVMDLTTGQIDAFAGNGTKGFGGDGGPAKDAKLAEPRDLEIGPDGDLYFADTDNGAVRAINLTTNVIRTVVGTGELGMDEQELLPANKFKLRRPFGVAFDPQGNLYVMDTLNSRIVKVMK